MPLLKEHQHVQVKFMLVIGLKPAAIRAHLIQAHGAQALSLPTIYHWYCRFEAGRTNVGDDQRSGRPRKLTPEALGRIQLIVEADKTVSLRQIATQAGLSVRTIHHALKNNLQLSKCPTHWVTHHLSADQKARRKWISEELNDRLIDDISILECIVTCDESWFFTYDPASHQSTSSWLSRNERRPQKPRLDQYCPKVMMVAFFDANGLIHREFIPQGAGITGERYLEILRRFRVSMACKRPECWEKQDFILQHDRAPAHRSDPVVQFLARNNTEVLPHPGYSPDLAQCDYWYFAKIKKHTKGWRFESVEELTKTNH